MPGSPDFLDTGDKAHRRGLVRKSSRCNNRGIQSRGFRGDSARDSQDDSRSGFDRVKRGKGESSETPPEVFRSSESRFKLVCARGKVQK